MPLPPEQNYAVALRSDPLQQEQLVAGVIERLECLGVRVWQGNPARLWLRTYLSPETLRRLHREIEEIVVSCDQRPDSCPWRRPAWRNY